MVPVSVTFRLLVNDIDSLSHFEPAIFLHYITTCYHVIIKASNKPPRYVINSGDEADLRC